jgi:hypothetical protein
LYDGIFCTKIAPAAEIIMPTPAQDVFTPKAIMKKPAESNIDL